jgi:hypothetical protein
MVAMTSSWMWSGEWMIRDEERWRIESLIYWEYRQIELMQSFDENTNAMPCTTLHHKISQLNYPTT